MRTINFSDVRSNLKQVLDDVASDHTITLIKRRDSEDAVLMSLTDFNSFQETLHLLSSAANASRLYAAIAQANATLPDGAVIEGPEDYPEPAAVARSSTKKIVHKKTIHKKIEGLTEGATARFFVSKVTTPTGPKRVAQRGLAASGKIIREASGKVKKATAKPAAKAASKKKVRA